MRFIIFEVCRSFWFAKLHQKAERHMLSTKVADGPAIGPGQSTRPTIKLNRTIILIS
jgi:hypothetical protein